MVRLTARNWRGVARCLALVSILAGGLAACASAPSPRPLADTRARPPNGSGLHGTDKPYQVNGRWYYPSAQPDYDETGLASWYGEPFHNRRTANGEIFDQDAPSAAHKTLPLPSLVEVTNLSNGRTIKVRLNDRGPFVEGRILDLSRAAARELGFDRQGTAQVRVRYLGPASPLIAGMTYAKAGPNHSSEDAFNALPSNTGDADTRVSQSPIETKPLPILAAPTTTVQAVQSVGPYAVQAGAYSRRESAERVAARLADTGGVSIQTIQRNGSTLYRVVVGSFSNAAAASDARVRIVASGFADARVIGPS